MAGPENHREQGGGVLKLHPVTPGSRCGLLHQPNPWAVGGGWQLAVGGPWGLSFTKNINGLLKDALE